jgi:hypothetical protein
VCREIAPELARVHLTAETPFPLVTREIGDAMEQHLADYLYVSTYRGYEQHWTAESLLPLAQALGQKRGWREARIARGGGCCRERANLNRHAAAVASFCLIESVTSNQTSASHLRAGLRLKVLCT